MLEAFQSIPRFQLIHGETPLFPMENYSKKFGRHLFIKRDDLNGVGAGGNKVRKLEYLLHEALQQGHRSVVTGGGLQSNHAAATALCALRAGLKPFLALTESVPIKTTHYEHGELF